KISPEWKEINAQTWRGFEDAYKAGKLRAIGVSNFEPEHIKALWETNDVRPMVDQLEFHPGYTQPDTVSWAQENGILVEAWSPLGSGAVLSDPTVNAIAAKYGVSAARLCVRFALMNKVLPLPKSTKAERISDNADVFGFEISEDDMKTLRNLPVLGFSGFSPENAPADAIA
ncbi:MAG: aldo/keto reductase, partial [Clostridia bacterium]|nr:aldo/keto reductase [Clostridia bacterium]